MLTPYAWRLLCLSLASFFLIQCPLALLVHWLTPLSIGVAGRLQPRNAASLLLILRLAPSVIAVVMVAGLCVPSYLWLEPEATEEGVGLLCLAAALLGAAAIAVSSARAAIILIRSRNVARLGQLDSQRGIRVIKGPAPAVALAGLLHPQLLVARRVIEALPADQLDAALCHERAHHAAHDNLKRLLIHAAPGVLPFLRASANLDHAWARFTEWAADDEAAAGDPHRSVALAAALAGVARLGIAPRATLLMTPLLDADEELSERVNRLLVTSVRCETRFRLPLLAALSLAISLSLLVARPATLSSAHALLELLLN